MLSFSRRLSLIPTNAIVVVHSFASRIDGYILDGDITLHKLPERREFTEFTVQTCQTSLCPGPLGLFRDHRESGRFKSYRTPNLSLLQTSHCRFSRCYVSFSFFSLPPAIAGCVAIDGGSSTRVIDHCVPTYTARARRF